ncbi:MAG: aerotolerance regulator BatA [Phycisphaeraceae bacterium]|nr:aerotolerance regulator BatA [Phycisphaeraceae bacterium]
MVDWEFRDPWFLLLVLLAPWIYRLLTQRTRSTLVYSTLAVLNQTRRSLRARLCHLPAALSALAVVAMAVALAGPRTGDDQTRVRREGIAIVMVVDRSGSMQARDLVKGDLNVDRLHVVKDLFEKFVLGSGDGQIGSGRGDDMIGLVGFARYADALCPLTLDHGNLVNIARSLEIVTRRSEDGTALGEGLALAVERLRKHPARSKVIILLTDGVNNAGDIDPTQAADLARGHGIRVYCIGAGTNGPAPVPVMNRSGRTVLRAMRVEIDERTLQMIARKTDGKYFRALDADGLAKIYGQIDRLERTEITEVRYMQYRQWYGPFATAALVLIGAASMLSGTLFRRLP